MAVSSTSNAWCLRCERHGSSFQRCSRCKLAYYCSRECQSRDWGTHKCCCENGAAAEQAEAVPSEESTVPIRVVYAGAGVETIAKVVVKSLLKNETRGVPMAWSNAISGLTANTTAEYMHRAQRRFIIMSKTCTEDGADKVVRLCRRTSVLEAFDTRGGVCARTRWLLDGSVGWNMEQSFSARLQALADRAGCPFEGVVFLALQIMFKRSKPPEHPRTITHNGRQLVHIVTKDVGVWFDVTLISSATLPPPGPEGTRECAVCSAVSAKCCTGCHRRYCSQACLDRDWHAGHKKECNRGGVDKKKN